MIKSLGLAAGLNAVLLTAMAGTAFAQSSGHGIDLRHGARELGVMVGSAYACLPEDGQRAARDEAESMFDMILHETGPATAYQFAVSLGYAAGAGTEDVNCDAVLEHVNNVKVRMFLGGNQ